MKPPRLSVIVVTVNTPALTRACLASVSAHTTVPYELLVVNNSRAAPIQRCLRTFRRIRLRRNPRNLGYARAANQGARDARGQYLCFLNSDTLVPPGWAERLLAAARRPGVGAVGPAAPRDGYQYGWPRAGSSTALTMTLLTDRLLQRRFRRRVEERPWLPGYCLLMPHTVMRQIGEFDHRFFFGWEDLDYSLRVRQHGYRLLRVQSVFVYHRQGGSSPPARHRTWFRTARRQFLKKWSSQLGRPLLAHGAPSATARRILRARMFRAATPPPMRQGPLVTLIVPFHNRARLLPETVRSILRQSHAAWQLVLVDDGSTDGSWAAARAFQDDRIECLRLPQRCGKPAAVNRALGRARGRWLTIVDSDDLMPPDALDARLRFLARHPEAAVVMGRIGRVIDADGDPVPRAHPIRRHVDRSWRTMRRMAGAIGGLLPEFFLGRGCPPAPLGAALWRRDLGEQIGPLDESFVPCAEDREYLTRLAAGRPIAVLDHDVLWYRVHGGNSSFRMMAGRVRSHPATWPMAQRLRERYALATRGRTS